MMTDKDCIDFNNYIDDLKTNTKEIKVDNYIKHHIHSTKMVMIFSL